MVTLAGLLKNLELSTELGSKFILVMGHKECMTLLHASEKFFAGGETQFPTLQQAAEDMGPCADAGFVCERAMTLNVIQTIQFLLESSGRLREQVQNGKLEIHGGMLDPFSGVVHFMGPIPGLAEIQKRVSILKALLRDTFNGRYEELVRCSDNSEVGFTMHFFDLFWL